MLARVKTPARARAAAELPKARTTVKARVSAGPTASPWRTRNNGDFSGCQEDRWLIAGPPSFGVTLSSLELPGYFYACQSLERIYGLRHRDRRTRTCPSI